MQVLLIATLLKEYSKNKVEFNSYNKWAPDYSYELSHKYHSGIL